MHNYKQWRSILGIGLLILIHLNYSYAETSAIFSQSDFYKKRYELQTLNQKLTNNRGEGFELLYGTRNFRAVLNGVQYRGGANNKFHRTNIRDNSNPLPNDGLINLCEEGFSTAIYFYATNFDTAPKRVTCASHKGPNKLQYLQLNPFNDEDLLQILEILWDGIKSGEGPIYTHCWNGWHASGYASAISLRQFCEFDAESAVAYWDLNTDGYNQEPSFEKIRTKIRNFVPLDNFKLTPKEKKQLCVEMPKLP